MRPEKESIVREVRHRMEGGRFVLLADYTGLSVEDMTDLRRRLREVSSSVYVAKNSFIKYAALQLGWDGLSKWLKGPTAVISGEGDLTAVAKLLRGFQRERGRLVLKGGRASGRDLSAADIGAIADLPPREALVAQMVGALSAPLHRLVFAMRHKILSLVLALKAIEKKKTEKPG
ncbi:MAG: 50S ribosomal protein L10 [Kiritimatiellae bacterium]|nr:50S ribosomal protein L10 [Kiritimatiellia bacterium]